MKNKPNNMFALPGQPAGKLTIAGCEYKLGKVFKHDFWAAACLYITDDEAAEFSHVVVKFGRETPLGLLYLKWIGQLMVSHECKVYKQLEGINGIPKFIERISPTCFAIEYVDSKPLDHYEKPPVGFFDQLEKIMRDIHSRDVAYVDSNKRSNILVRSSDSAPVVIDFQISIRKHNGNLLLWPWIKYFQEKDIYHIFKHKRRMSPDELTEEQLEISRKRTGLHKLHRKLTKPYRAMRRDYLNKKMNSGNLISPTAELETHHQPEKESWRNLQDKEAK